MTNMAIRYFKIEGDWSGKVLDAVPQSTDGEVHLWEHNDGDNQLWYWDGPNSDILRNKMFPNKVTQTILNNLSISVDRSDGLV